MEITALATNVRKTGITGNFSYDFAAIFSDPHISLIFSFFFSIFFNCLKYKTKVMYSG